MNLKKLIPITFYYSSKIAPRLSAKLAYQLMNLPRRSNKTEKEMDYWMTGALLEFRSGRVARKWGTSETIVFLLHGWESRGATFSKLIPLLLKEGFQVIAWDGPAHGDSPGRKNKCSSLRLLFR